MVLGGIRRFWHSSLELGIYFFRRSYIFIIINKTINKRLYNQSELEN